MYDLLAFGITWSVGGVALLVGFLVISMAVAAAYSGWTLPAATRWRDLGRVAHSDNAQVTAQCLIADGIVITGGLRAAPTPSP